MTRGANSSTKTAASVVSKTQQQSPTKHQAASANPSKPTSAQPTQQLQAAVSPSKQLTAPSTRVPASPSTQQHHSSTQLLASLCTPQRAPSSQLLAAAKGTLTDLQKAISQAAKQGGAAGSHTVHVDDQDELDLLEAYYKSSSCSCGTFVPAALHLQLLGEACLSSMQDALTRHLQQFVPIVQLWELPIDCSELHPYSLLHPAAAAAAACLRTYAHGAATSMGC